MTRAWAWVVAHRLRLLLRGAFVALLLAALFLPYISLQLIKSNNYRSYLALLGSRREQIVNKLTHPSAQLGLLNPKRLSGPPVPLHPYVLPYGAVRADEPYVMRDFVQALGCATRYVDVGFVCAAVDSRTRGVAPVQVDAAGGGPRIYVVGTFVSTLLTARVPAKQVATAQSLYAGSVVAAVAAAHRLQLDVTAGGKTYSWVAPVQLRIGIDRKTKQPTAALAMTAYRLEGASGAVDAQKVAFNSIWIRQGECRDGSAAAVCLRDSVFSIIVPITEGPSADARVPDDVVIRLRVFSPAGVTPETLLDSNSEIAQAPFARRDILDLLSPDESLEITRAEDGKETLVFEAKPPSPISARAESWVLPIVKAIKVIGVSLTSTDATPVPLPILGRQFAIKHSGNVRGVDVALTPVAERIMIYAVGMFMTICIAWGVIEWGIVRYLGRLRLRAAAVSSAVRNDEDLSRVRLTDLRGGDEAGVLAAGLDDLLALIAEKVEREKLRAARDKDMWRAIGHEIRSPIQALSSLHDQEADPSYRYIKRMQRAVTVLYENASPEVAIASAEVEGEQVDLDAFLKIVAANAPGAGLDNTVYASAGQVVPVRGDPAALEDVITHVLKNAIRYRRPESAVTMSLVVEDNTAVLSIHDVGPQIPDDMLEKIFEYGVSDQKEESEAGGRGQGLYVARSYMAKMGGTIAAKNADDGVTFEIRMPLTK